MGEGVSLVLPRNGFSVGHSLEISDPFARELGLSQVSSLLSVSLSREHVSLCERNSSGEQVLSGERNLPVHAGARHAPPVTDWQDPCLSRAFFPTLASRIEMAKSWVHDPDLSDIRGLDSFFNFQIFSPAILAVETVFALDLPAALKRDPLYSSSGVGALSLILGSLGADPVVYEGKGTNGPLLTAGLRGTDSSGARDPKADNTADIITEAADAVPDVAAIGLIADPGAISDFLSTALQISLYQQGSAHPSSVPFRSEHGVSFLGFGGGDFLLIHLDARSVKRILGMSNITMKALSGRLLCRSKDEDLPVSSFPCRWLLELIFPHFRAALAYAAFPVSAGSDPGGSVLTASEMHKYWGPDLVPHSLPTPATGSLRLLLTEYASDYPDLFRCCAFLPEGMKLSWGHLRFSVYH